jgi:hypothetical protein
MMQDAHVPLNEQDARRLQFCHAYIVALAQGDGETLARVLQAAEQDSVLERMLLALHAAEAQEKHVTTSLREMRAMKKVLQTYALLEAQDATSGHSAHRVDTAPLKNVAEKESEY